jgi:hypothetical protein
VFIVQYDIRVYGLNFLRAKYRPVFFTAAEKGVGSAVCLNAVYGKLIVCYVNLYLRRVSGDENRTAPQRGDDFSLIV